MGDVPGTALPGHVHRGALSGPPVRTRPGRPHTAALQPHTARTTSSARRAQRFRRCAHQTPGRIPWGESAPGHGKAPCSPARGGTSVAGRLLPIVLGSVRLRGACACVGRPIVLDPSGLRAFGLPTQAHPFGSLAVGHPFLQPGTQWARTDGSPYGPLATSTRRLSVPRPGRSRARRRPCRSGGGGRCGSPAP